MNPIDPSMDQQASPAGAELPSGELDREGAMAKADLHKLAQYSFKLFKKIQDEDQLEAWVQAKITKAADYIASVYHYLEYEMEFSEYGQKLENSEMYSESQKVVLKARLNEAKEKIKALKVGQANKKKVEEGIFGGDHTACEACGGSGHVVTPERAVPEHVKAKVAKYNRQAKAFHAASKRIDANKNGIPDDEEVDEDFESLKKTGDKSKTSKGGTVTKTNTGIKHTRDPKSYSDEPHTEPKSQAKSRSASEKEGDKAADKQTEKDSKDYEKRFPGSVTKVSAGKKVDPNAKKEKEEEVDETYGQGIYEGKTEVQYDKDGKRTGVKHTSTHKYSDEPHTEPKSQAKSRSASEKEGDKAADKAQEKDYKAAKKANPMGVRRYSLGKQVDEAKAKPDFLDMDKDGDKKEPMKKALKDKSVKEAAPSAGLTKAQKSATVKDAKAGKDIGKPGKGFAKVEKAAAKGGAKDPKAVAAAAMWKNKVKAVKEAAEEKKAKKDYDGDGKVESGKDEHAGSVDKAIKASKAKETVKESADTTRIRALMQRLNG